MLSFHNGLCKLVPECQTILDFAAATDDGGDSGDNRNSKLC